MRFKKIIICLVLGETFLLGSVRSQEAAQNLSLPEGDPVAGRQAFERLKCYSCHEVSGDRDMEKPCVTPVCPPLGVRQSQYKANFIADSIIFPSHAVMPGAEGRSPIQGVSRMGDFSEAITIRELADLVAYLQSLDEEV